MVEVLGGSTGSLNLGNSKGSRDRLCIDLSWVDAVGSLGLSLFLPEPTFQGSRSSQKVNSPNQDGGRFPSIWLPSFLSLWASSSRISMN